eukprot:1154152-Pelagomonas_calceolata.AAC.3
MHTHIHKPDKASLHLISLRERAIHPFFLLNMCGQVFHMPLSVLVQLLRMEHRCLCLDAAISLTAGTAKLVVATKKLIIMHPRAAPQSTHFTLELFSNAQPRDKDLQPSGRCKFEQALLLIPICAVFPWLKDALAPAYFQSRLFQQGKLCIPLPLGSQAAHDSNPVACKASLSCCTAARARTYPKLTGLLLVPLDCVTVEVPGKGKTVLGDLTTAEMVQLYIKPMTEKPKLDYVQ